MINVCVQTRIDLILLFFFIEEDDDEDNLVMPGVGPIAMHASNQDDPLLEIKDDVNRFCSFISSFD